MNHKSSSHKPYSSVTHYFWAHIYFLLFYQRKLWVWVRVIQISYICSLRSNVKPSDHVSGLANWIRSTRTKMWQTKTLRIAVKIMCKLRSPKHVLGPNRCILSLLSFHTLSWVFLSRAAHWCLNSYSIASTSEVSQCNWVSFSWFFFCFPLGNLGLISLGVTQILMCCQSQFRVWWKKKPLYLSLRNATANSKLHSLDSSLESITLC